jgi:hypothetical protein
MFNTTLVFKIQHFCNHKTVWHILNISKWELKRNQQKGEEEKKAQSYLMSNKRIFTINKVCSCRPKDMKMEPIETQNIQQEKK